MTNFLCEYDEDIKELAKDLLGILPELNHEGLDCKVGAFFRVVISGGHSFILQACDLYATLVAMKLLKIIIYSTDTGKEPFSAWLESLERKTRAIVRNRLDRMILGNWGDAKVIKGGGSIWELRIDHGPGYRVYFGTEGRTLVILLTGGAKKSQNRDIAKAKSYWLEYKEML